jgi:hypothetical protein
MAPARARDLGVVGDEALAHPRIGDERHAVVQELVHRGPSAEQRAVGRVGVHEDEDTRSAATPGHAEVDRATTAVDRHHEHLQAVARVFAEHRRGARDGVGGPLAQPLGRARHVGVEHRELDVGAVGLETLQVEIAERVVAQPREHRGIEAVSGLWRVAGAVHERPRNRGLDTLGELELHRDLDVVGDFIGTPQPHPLAHDDAVADPSHAPAPSLALTHARQPDPIRDAVAGSDAVEAEPTTHVRKLGLATDVADLVDVVGRVVVARHEKVRGLTREAQLDVHRRRARSDRRAIVPSLHRRSRLTTGRGSRRRGVARDCGQHDDVARSPSHGDLFANETTGVTAKLCARPRLGSRRWPAQRPPEGE